MPRKSKKARSQSKRKTQKKPRKKSSKKYERKTQTQTNITRQDKNYTIDITHTTDNIKPIGTTTSNINVEVPIGKDMTLYQYLFPGIPGYETNYLKIDQNGNIKKFAWENFPPKTKEQKIKYCNYIKENLNIETCNIDDYIDDLRHIPGDLADDELWMLDHYVITKIKKNIVYILSTKFGQKYVEFFNKNIVLHRGFYSKFLHVISGINSILKNFQYKDDFDIVYSGGELIFFIKDGKPVEYNRKVFVELALYLYNIVKNDSELVKIYAEQRKILTDIHMERFGKNKNENEKFDHPLILIISALFSTIGQKYNLTTIQCDLNWNLKNNFGGVSFLATSDLGNKYNGRSHEETHIHEFTVNILLDSGVYPDLLSTFDEYGNYIITTTFGASTVYNELDEKYNDGKKQMRLYNKLYKFLLKADASKYEHSHKHSH